MASCDSVADLARISIAWPCRPASGGRAIRTRICIGCRRITFARRRSDAIVWAAEATAARNETFNITNGDVFVWRNVWPAIADERGVDPGPDRPMSLGKVLPAKAESGTTWSRNTASGA